MTDITSHEIDTDETWPVLDTPLVPDPIHPSVLTNPLRSIYRFPHADRWTAVRNDRAARARIAARRRIVGR